MTGKIVPDFGTGLHRVDDGSSRPRLTAPLRRFRVTDEIYYRAILRAVALGETVTDVVQRALAVYGAEDDALDGRVDVGR